MTSRNFFLNARMGTDLLLAASGEKVSITATTLLYLQVLQMLMHLFEENTIILLMSYS